MRKSICLFCVSALIIGSASCTRKDLDEGKSGENEHSELMTLGGVAEMLAALPIGGEQMFEVYDAVWASSDNGYDEEYTLYNLFEAPGSGVGDDIASAKGRVAARRAVGSGAAGKAFSDRARRRYAASGGGATLRSMIEEYLSEQMQTRTAGTSTEALIQEMSASDMQIYWPYSEDWDGETLPIITFDPGMGAESNYGYLLKIGDDGSRSVESVVVNEAMAREHPVWVVNRNDDSSYTPFEMFLRDDTELSATIKAAGGSGTLSTGVRNCSFQEDGRLNAGKKYRNLMLKSFKMLRNYDSWFGGASEFFIKCGTIKGFAAKTEAEMKQYSPTVTDMMIVVKRKYVGRELPVDALIFSEFTNQLDKLAFLVTEDDGGTRTNWKCQAVVKINSKSYGIELEIPFNEKDDIVWRGQLAASFFQEEDEVVGRFGDVVITFALE